MWVAFLMNVVVVGSDHNASHQWHLWCAHGHGYTINIDWIRMWKLSWSKSKTVPKFYGTAFAVSNENKLSQRWLSLPAHLQQCPGNRGTVVVARTAPPHTQQLHLDRCCVDPHGRNSKPIHIQNRMVYQMLKCNIPFSIERCPPPSPSDKLKSKCKSK